MKNHIAFKFLAVILCAACLLGTLGSAAGIIALTGMDLYNKTVEQVVEENVSHEAKYFAQNAALRYASETLGGCPEEVLWDRYQTYWVGGTFAPERYGYSILDPEGNVLTQGGLLGEGEGNSTMTVPVSGQYMHVISVEEIVEEADPEGTVYINNLGQVSGDVYEIRSTSVDGGATGHASYQEPLGWMYWENGDAAFEGSFHNTIEKGEVTHVQFLNETGEVIFEARDTEAVGRFYVGGDGLFRYESYVINGRPQEPEEGELIYTAEFVSVDEVWDRISSSDPVGTVHFAGDGNVTFRMRVRSVGMTNFEKITGFTLLDRYDEVLYELEGQTAAAGGCLYLDEEGKLCFDLSRYQPDAARVASETEPTMPETEATEVTEAGETEGEDAQSDSTEPTTVTEETEATEETGAAEETEATETVEGQEDEDGTEPTAAEETVPETTVPPTAPATEPEPEPEPTTAPSEPLIINGRDVSEYEINRIRYTDDQGRRMLVQYVYVPMPEYTVELYIGELGSEPLFELLSVVRYFRNELFLILGVSLLLCAVAAVYLCCSAGRKPKREELRAGGLNRIPLDLYFALMVCGVCGFVALGALGVGFMIENSLLACAAAVLVTGFFACLMIVGFCFAFAAQVKTPGGYWWRNSLCGRCLFLTVRILKWMKNLVFKTLIPFALRVLKWCWNLAAGFFRWIGRCVKGTVRLLPMTWQWVAAGMLMALLCSVAFGRRTPFLFRMIAFGGCACVIIYAARSFGILMEAAKRMGKGDLDTKVQNKTLLGCFDEFAGDLNDLADVAVVAAQKQLKSERMKTELITNVSHDIRTPLTSIINYVDLLQKPHTEQEQEAYLEVLARQSQQLKKLIEDLMEMSKASTGNMAVDITEIDAVEAVNQALGEFADKLEKAQLIPVFRHSADSAQMMADGRLTWRVLNNLLVNAVKYAMPGTRLYVDLSQVEGKVVISLKNISREELNMEAEELMERFVRGDGSRNTEGSGLGLNIAKSLMELQKGQLQLLVDGDLFKVTLIFPGV